MDYSSVINELIVMVVIIGIGFLGSKWGLINSGVSKALSDVTMYIAFPALLITSMAKDYSSQILRNSLLLIVISVFVYASLIFLAWLWGKWIIKTVENRNILKFMLVFGNVAIIGYPLVSVIYGDLGVFYAASFNIIHGVLTVTYGVMLMTNQGFSKNIKDYKSLINPGFVAIIIGYVLFISGIKLPYIFLKPLQLLGSTSIPIPMLVLGSSLGQIKMKQIIGVKQIWLLSVYRLLVFPLMLLLVLKLFSLNLYLINIPVIIMATPVGVLATVMATTYRNDSDLASAGVVLSTLLSIISLPFIIWAIGFFNKSI